MALFFWRTMHFLLAGRVPWRKLLPSAVLTGAFFAGLGVFSKFYFSSTISSWNGSFVERPAARRRDRKRL